MLAKLISDIFCFWLIAKLWRTVLAGFIAFIGLVLALIGIAYLLAKEAIGIYLLSTGIALTVYGYRRIRIRQATSWRLDSASEQQKEFARELGIKFHKGITKGELSDKISAVTGK